MIVKVQLSLMTTHASQRVLIYNKDRSIHYEGEATTEVKAVMHGRHKAFFRAGITSDMKVDLIEEVRDYSW